MATDGQDNYFPDLEGDFELKGPDDVPYLDSQHPSVPEAIGESLVGKNYWSIKFQRVQYGTFNDEPVCLIVVECKFHAEDQHRHRFTWAEVGVAFQSRSRESSVVVEKHIPETAFGITVPETRESCWTLKTAVSATMPGIPATIDIFNASLSKSRQYTIDRIATMKGTARGFPKSNKVVWTIEEANQEGIPLKLPPLVILLGYAPGQPFVVKFSINAKVGFSLNPSRWPVFAKSLAPIDFSEQKQLIKKDAIILDKDFSKLDLTSLTSLGFSEGQLHASS